MAEESREIRLPLPEGFLLIGSDYKRNSQLPGTGIPLGRHQVCGGEFNILPISPENSVIICSRCSCRLPFPNKIRTFNELGNHFLFSSDMD
jgi:hypothetical protein